MHTLLFATHNEHKVSEIQLLIPASIHIISLDEAGIHESIPEPFETLEENAIEKSRVILERNGKDCFSEDTGLEVEALDGAPGVRSARYAGDAAHPEENILLLLKNLEGKANRKAQFRTIISLEWKGKRYLYEGICPGTILTEKSGEKGFGYDPVFVPDGARVSFAQMTPNEKSTFSHRAKALAKLVDFLKTA